MSDRILAKLEKEHQEIRHNLQSRTGKDSVTASNYEAVYEALLSKGMTDKVTNLHLMINAGFLAILERNILELTREAGEREVLMLERMNEKMVAYAQECDRVTQDLNQENASLKQKLLDKERELVLVSTEKDTNTDSLLWRKGEYDKLETSTKEIIRQNKKLVCENRELVATLKKTEERLERQKFFHDYEVKKNQERVAEAITNKADTPKPARESGLGATPESVST